MLRKSPRSAWKAGLLAAALITGTLASGTASAVIGEDTTGTTFAFSAKLDIGAGKRACSGALVDPYWVITAASCFTDTPSDLSTVTVGAPKDKTTATIGRTDVTATGGHVSDIVELVPRTDRDLVMARLATPATGITPITLSATAPTTGEELRVAGYGRTKTVWANDKLHTATFTVSTIATTGIDLATKTPTDAAICKGDTGGPAWRNVNGTPQLTAVNSRSWQGGCLGTPTTETRTGAHNTRVDDLVEWVKVQRFRTAEVKAGTHVQIIGSDNAMWDTVADYNIGRWSDGGWAPMDHSNLIAIDSVAIGDTVHVYGIAADGHVYGRDGKVGGSWTPWGEVPGSAVGAKDITAAARGNVVDLMIIGGDGSLYSTTADYNAGAWNPAWNKIGTNNLKAITSSATNNVVHVYAINEDNRVYGRDADYNAGRWTEWGEVPGSAVGAKDITAAARGNVIDLMIIGSDGSLYSTTADYNAGAWNPAWNKIGTNNLKAITSSATNNVVHVYAINEDNRVYGRDADYNAGRWTEWGEVPGSAVGAKDITATATG